MVRHLTATEALLMVRHPVGKSLTARLLTVMEVLLMAKNLQVKLRTVRNPRKIC